MTVKRLLIVIDRPDWAFGRIAQAIKCHCEVENLEIRIFPLKGNQQDLPGVYEQADFTFFMHWALVLEQRKTIKSRIFSSRFEFKKLVIPDFVDLDRTLVGIHSHDDWDNQQSRPDIMVLPPESLVDQLARFKGVNTVSNRLYSLFYQAGLNDLYYTPNGVDAVTFKPSKPVGEQSLLKIGCTGTVKRDWNKGLTEFIQPLGDLPFVDLRLAINDRDRLVPQQQMPDFYNDLDVYVCASASEGFSMSALEAAACGRPIVSTCVGGSEDLIIDGENGFLVERKGEAFVEKLSRLQKDRELLVRMGKRNRELVEKKWSWQSRASDWLSFIKSNLPI